MTITFVLPYPNITSFGVRLLSSCLRKDGHDTRLVFLPDPFDDDLVYGQARYDDRVLDELVELCGDSDLLGVSLMTNHFDGAVQITKKLKQALSIPVVWGGVHATIRPEECLEYADMVSIGEAEESLSELVSRLASGEEHLNTAGFWFRTDTGIKHNPVRPLPKDLDKYPLPDYSMKNHHIMDGRHLVPLTEEHMRTFLSGATVSRHLGKTGYLAMTGRGCPYSCSYCINETMKKMFGTGALRWRSIPDVIDEFVWVRENMPYVDYIWISDDEFMARKEDDLRVFCQEYKKKIGLPFSCLVSPLSVTDEKMSLLVDAGLCYVQMGVQSGSPRMQERFNRKHMTNERMMNAMRIINAYKDRMAPPSYDFLLDAPGETEEDTVASLRFVSEIPKPFRLQPFGLVLYPGTRMNEEAVANGDIKDERREVYNKSLAMRRVNYLNLLFPLARNGHLPARLLRFLIGRPVVKIMNSRALRPLLGAALRFFKGVRRVLRRQPA